MWKLEEKKWIKRGSHENEEERKWLSRVEEVDQKKVGGGKAGTGEWSLPNYVLCMYNYVTVNHIYVYNYNVPIKKQSWIPSKEPESTKLHPLLSTSLWSWGWSFFSPMESAIGCSQTPADATHPQQGYLHLVWLKVPFLGGSRAHTCNAGGALCFSWQLSRYRTQSQLDPWGPVVFLRCWWRVGSDTGPGKESHAHLMLPWTSLLFCFQMMQHWCLSLLSFL